MVNNSKFSKFGYFNFFVKRLLSDYLRIDFDIDLNGWKPKQGQKDKLGRLIEDRIYNRKDIDKNIIFDERT